MSSIADFTAIGHTEKPHGINGELKLNVQEAYYSVLPDIDILFLNIKGKPTPYFIEDLRGGTKLILKLEEIDSREAALAISSQEVLVRTSDLPTIEDLSNVQFSRLLGFVVHDKHEGEIGSIKEIVTLPFQEMAAIDYQEREILLPLHKNMIVKIDKAQNTILMDLPEGILAL
jgi:16S rRNA processing protein RimM